MNEINRPYEFSKDLPEIIPDATERGWQEMPGGWRLLTNETIVPGRLPFIEKKEGGYRIGLLLINERKKAYSSAFYGSLDLAAEEAEKLVGENIDDLGFEIYDKESVDQPDIESET